MQGSWTITACLIGQDFSSAASYELGTRIDSWCGCWLLAYLLVLSIFLRNVNAWLFYRDDGRYSVDLDDMSLF